MTIVESFLLFLPLCFAICVVSSTLRRDSISSVLKHATRLFIYLTGTVVVVCVILYWLMEWVLNR